MADLAFRIGLCTTCNHSRTVKAKSGSEFRLCSRSKSELAFPKYPQLPVTKCAGYQRCSESDEDSSGDWLQLRFTAEMLKVIEDLSQVPAWMVGASELPGAEEYGVVAQLARADAEQLVSLCQLYISGEPAAVGFEDRSQVLQAVVAAVNDAQTQGIRR